MNKGKVIDLVANDGSVRQYRRLSDRLPDFLAEYPPQDGYQVMTEMKDLLSLQEGRLRLMEAAVVNGRKPEQVGLPALSEATEMVCMCALVSPTGKEITRRTASRNIAGEKDLERLETAAFQRLLAALGFGGDVFDDDEDAIIATMSKGGSEAPALGSTRIKPVESSWNAQPSREATVRQGEVECAKSNEQQAPAPRKNAPTASEKARAAEGSSESAAIAMQANEGSIAEDIPLATARQIRNLAAQAGEVVPSVTSMEEAREQLRRLSRAVTAKRQSAAAS